MNDNKQSNTDHHEHQVVDEAEFLRTLVNQEGKTEQEEFEFNQPFMNSRQIVYTKQGGCFNVSSMLINLLVFTLVLMVTSGWFSGFYLANVWAAFETALWMSVLNVVLKPIIVILTLPLTILTFGMFYVVVNGVILLIADYIMGPLFEIHSFGVAIFASIFISVLRLLINRYVLKDSSFRMN
ncbi:MAG TPA: phage holin family protein [Firmicutes bacterium]|nr:phage holin family protein [Bacillota bacterium]